MMADKLDLILTKLNAIESKLNALISAIAEGDDQDQSEMFDFDGNAYGLERDQNQEL
jgi:hypothetical protein